MSERGSRMAFRLGACALPIMLAVAATSALSSGVPSPEAVREALRAELQHGRYVLTPADAATEQTLSAVLMRLVTVVFGAIAKGLQWLFQKLSFPLSGLGLDAAVAGKVLLVLVAAVGVALVAALAWVLLQRARQRAERALAEEGFSGRSLAEATDQELLSLTSRRALVAARRAAAEGEFRLAVRYAFFALVIRLAELGSFDLDVKRTNREYLSRLPREALDHAVLRTAVDVFDRKWYGQERVSAVEYDGFEILVRPVVEREGGTA